MISFGIGIPTLNRYDLLMPSLWKYVQDFSNNEILVVNNGIQHIDTSLLPNVKVHWTERNLGVAASWNLMCDRIFEHHTHAVIVNDDVYLGYGERAILNAIERNPSSLIQSLCSWSIFIIPKTLYEQIGKFDEGFYPAYYEDSDYLYRMKLMGIRQAIDDSLNPSIYRISMTYEKNPELVNESMRLNADRYKRKWGGSPLLETYSTPFNK